MPTLSNHILEVEISTEGAELQRIYNKQTKLEYLWNGNPDYWAKRSPVLFPIVGELRNQTYTYNGKSYQLSRHGFARDMTFKETEEADNTISFCVKSTPETLKMYPFNFTLTIRYTLDEDRLYAVYYVENMNNETMYFSLGAHPAFNVPLVPGTAFEDYRLVFSQVENAKRYPLTAEGLIENKPEVFLQNAEQLPLKRSLFAHDALVLKDIQSASIELESDKTDHGFIFYFDMFPYLGLWNKNNGDFLCIEPWFGVADSTDATGDLTRKEGIVKLEARKTFECQWSIECY